MYLQFLRLNSILQKKARLQKKRSDFREENKIHELTISLQIRMSRFLPHRSVVDDEQQRPPKRDLYTH